MRCRSGDVDALAGAMPRESEGVTINVKRPETLLAVMRVLCQRLADRAADVPRSPPFPSEKLGIRDGRTEG